MSTPETVDFSNYDLRTVNLYEIGNKVIPTVAELANVELGEQPNEASLRALIKAGGPDKDLQKNIGLVRDKLGADAVKTMTQWVEEDAGLLRPLNRFYVQDSQPADIDGRHAVIGGGKARPMLKRAFVALTLPVASTQITLFGSQNVMAEADHTLVGHYMSIHDGELPTENDFMREYIKPLLEVAGHKPDLLETGSASGTKALGELFAERPGLLSDPIVMPSNMPAARQVAGQFRRAAILADNSFDSEGTQLLIKSDSIPLARKGESPETHQNPETAIAQMCRDALYMHLNQQTLA